EVAEGPIHDIDALGCLVVFTPGHYWNGAPPRGVRVEQARAGGRFRAGLEPEARYRSRLSARKGHDAAGRALELDRDGADVVVHLLRGFVRTGKCLAVGVLPPRV